MSTTNPDTTVTGAQYKIKPEHIDLIKDTVFLELFEQVLIKLNPETAAILSAAKEDNASTAHLAHLPNIASYTPTRPEVVGFFQEASHVVRLRFIPDRKTADTIEDMMWGEDKDKKMKHRVIKSIECREGANRDGYFISMYGDSESDMKEAIKERLFKPLLGENAYEELFSATCKEVEANPMSVISMNMRLAVRNL